MAIIKDAGSALPPDPDYAVEPRHTLEVDLSKSTTVQDGFTEVVVMPELSEIRAQLAAGSISKQGAAAELMRRIPRLSDDLRRAKADIARRGTQSR